jgi:glycosyltransferase involved in cell wall biosynthesis
LRVLVFIPSYNDTETALQIAEQFLVNESVSGVLIVDDSDDSKCVEIARQIRNEKIEVIFRVRSGKWSAWKLALTRAREYDGLIEVDSDVEIRDPDVVVSSLRDHDAVTAYQEIVLPNKGLGRAVGEAYQRMHQDLKAMGKFNMGGQVIALSNKAVSTLLHYRFFEEPVLADDHVIGLACRVLELKCTTIDCGLRIGLPSTISDWISYRSRHRGAINWAEKYVASKTGKAKETADASRADYVFSLRYFIKDMFKTLKVGGFLLLILFAVASLLPLENQTRWSRLESEKI